MKFLNNILLIAMLSNTGFIYAARAAARQAQPQQTSVQPVAAKTTATSTRSRGKTTTPAPQKPSTQQQYTQILNSIKATTPSSADYQTLINIKNEVENQIQQVEQAKIYAEITPNQGPLPQQPKNSQSRVAMRYVESPWSERDSTG